MDAYKCVGGPLNGQFISQEDDLNSFRVFVDIGSAVEQHEYVKAKLINGGYEWLWENCKYEQRN